MRPWSRVGSRALASSRSSGRGLVALLAGLGLLGSGGASVGGEAEEEKPDAGSLIVSLGPGAQVDWTRGLLVATGAAAGDLRAPSAEVARVKAERQARDAARLRLRKLARDLPLADGRALGAALGGEASARFERALAAVLDQRVEHASDGSVVLEAALPLEAARSAVFGPGAPAAAGGESGPTALLVEAGRHLKRPALGLKLAAGKERYAGPTVFARRFEALGPERLGARPVRVRASGFSGGALQLDGKDAPGQLAEARAAGALVVVEMTQRGRGEERAGEGRRKPDKKETKR